MADLAQMSTEELLKLKAGAEATKAPVSADISKLSTEELLKLRTSEKPKEEGGIVHNLAKLGAPIEMAMTLGSAIPAGLGNVATRLHGMVTGRDVNETKAAGDKVQEALTYRPRGETAQEGLTMLGKLLEESKIAGLGPTGAVALGALPRATNIAVQSVKPALVRAEVAAAPALNRAKGLIRGAEEPAMAGGGAAVSDAEMLARQRAGSLPVPIQLSKGEATRDFDQLRLEKEGMKASGQAGEALRAHAADNVEKVIKNFEAWIDETGAQAPDLLGTGKAVDRPLVKRMESAKAEIRQAYNDAEAAGHMAQPVKTDDLVKWVNENQSSTKLAPIIKTTEDELVRLGGATRDANGVLVAKEMPINDIEKMRKRIVRDSKADATNEHYGTEANRLIDRMTEGQGGDLYRKARGMFAEYAAEFKNQGAVRKLVSTKPGTTDRSVALEDVWQHTVMNGSHQDTKNILRSLERAGPEGQQAVKEIEGQTMNYILGKTTENAARDIRNNPIPSFSKIDKAVRALDSDGKLELIFGKKRAEQIRDMRDVIRDIQTAPPGAINTSTTAAVMKEALEAMMTGRLPTAASKTMAGVRAALAERKFGRQVQDALKQPDLQP